MTNKDERIAGLEAQLKRQRPYALLGDAVSAGLFDGRHDIDYSELFDMAESTGVIIPVKGGFDPDKHVDFYGINPEKGDPWYDGCLPLEEQEQ